MSSVAVATLAGYFHPTPGSEGHRFQTFRSKTCWPGPMIARSDSSRSVANWIRRSCRTPPRRGFFDFRSAKTDPKSQNKGGLGIIPNKCSFFFCGKLDLPDLYKFFVISRNAMTCVRGSKNHRDLLQFGAAVWVKAASLMLGVNIFIIVHQPWWHKDMQQWPTMSIYMVIVHFRIQEFWSTTIYTKEYAAASGVIQYLQTASGPDCSESLQGRPGTEPFYGMQMLNKDMIRYRKMSSFSLSQMEPYRNKQCKITICKINRSSQTNNCLSLHWKNPQGFGWPLVAHYGAKATISNLKKEIERAWKMVEAVGQRPKVVLTTLVRKKGSIQRKKCGVTVTVGEFQPEFLRAWGFPREGTEGERNHPQLEGDRPPICWGSVDGEFFQRLAFVQRENMDVTSVESVIKPQECLLVQQTRSFFSFSAFKHRFCWDNQNGRWRSPIWATSLSKARCLCWTQAVGGLGMSFFIFSWTRFWEKSWQRNLLSHRFGWTWTLKMNPGIQSDNLTLRRRAQCESGVHGFHVNGGELWSPQANNLHLTTALKLFALPFLSNRFAFMKLGWMDTQLNSLVESLPTVLDDGTAPWNSLDCQENTVNSLIAQLGAPKYRGKVSLHWVIHLV